MFDGWLSSILDDVVDAIESVVKGLQLSVETERARVEAMPEGPAKRAAMAALRKQEEAVLAKEAEAAAVKAYAEQRRESSESTAEALAQAMAASHVE